MMTSSHVIMMTQIGTAINTKEKRKVYMNDIHELVLQVIAGFNNGKFDEVSDLQRCR